MVLPNSDPRTAEVAKRLEPELGRCVILVVDLKGLPAEKKHCVISSSVKLDNLPVFLAQSSTPSPSWLNQAANWFNNFINRRFAGDRMKLAGTYFLYAAGCILTLSLIGGPKFVPVVISASFIEGAEIAKTFSGPELPATFEPALLLAAG